MSEYTTAAPPSRALVISDRSGGNALLLAARAAISFGNGGGKLSDGSGLRVAASPVSGLRAGVWTFQSDAIVFTSASLYPISLGSRNDTSFRLGQAEQTSL